MKKLLLFFVCLLSVVNCLGFSVAEKGIAKAKIILPKNPSFNEKYAAETLAEYIKMSTDAELEISHNPSAVGNIFLKVNPKLKIRGSYPYKNQFDTCAVTVKGKNLYLEGINDRAVCYAVFEFLEQYAGVRFFTSDKKFVPRKDFVRCPDKLRYIHASPFMVRDTDQKGIADTEAGFKLRINGYNMTRRTKWGGISIARDFCHSMQTYLPVSVYGKEHPEYYPLINGERKTDKEADACFSNSEVRKVLAENVIKILDESRIKNMIDISLMDTNDRCQCENCRKAEEKYGGFTGLFLENINYIADEVKKKYPDTLVETLAYHQTQIPPKNFDLRDNVVVRLCCTHNNHGENYADLDKYAPYGETDYDKGYANKNGANTEFDGILKGWQKLTDKLYVWEYLVNYRSLHMFQPTLHVRKANLNYFAKNNVIAVFSESDRDNMQAGFNELRMYLEAKLMWDPSLDDRELTEDFCRGVYGEGSEDILKILDYMTEYYSQKHYYITHSMTTMNWFENIDMIKVIYMFYDAMKKTANNPYCNDKITSLYMSFLAGWYTKPQKDFEEIRDACYLTWKTKGEFYRYFGEYSEKHSNPYYSEFCPFDKTKIAKDLKKYGDVPEVCRELKDNEWFEITAPDLGVLTKYGGYLKYDKEASNEQIVIMQPNGKWNTYITWSSGNVALAEKEGYNSFDIYIKAKSVGKTGDTGDGVYFGIYDNCILQWVYRKATPLSAINNDRWSYVYAGNWKFGDSPDPCFYMVGLENTNVKEYAVDKAVFIKRR